MDTTRPLAIFGGTFDPVHIGHLRAAWEASEALDAEVHLVPAKTPPHRPQPVASAAERAALLRVALAGQDRLKLDLREIDRPGPSYTFDTLASLRAEHGDRRPFVLLIGADAFVGLSAWYRWRELFELAHVCVLTRPAQIPAMPDELASEVASRRAEGPGALHTAPGGRVLDMVVSALGISATRIRSLLAEGREPRWLVPSVLLDDPRLLEAYRKSRDSGLGTRDSEAASREQGTGNREPGTRNREQGGTR